MPGELSGKAAIVGIGATDFSKNSGRSELRLAAEAVLDALDDAGLTPGDVDGMVTFTMDSNTEVSIARATGIGDLKFFSKIHHGGGAACATRCRRVWWRTLIRPAWTTRFRIRTGCPPPQRRLR
jgi:hypothetical protein